MSPPDLAVGVALLSNTTICEASRLLAGTPGDPGDFREQRATALALLDLMSTIDASVLFEQVVSLPATLPPDVRALALRQELVEGRVVSQMPDSEDRYVVGQALLNSFAAVDGYQAIAGPGDHLGSALSFPDYAAINARELGITRDPGAAMREGDDVSMHLGRLGTASTADSFAQAAREVVGWLEYGRSGAYESSVDAARAMYYVFTSEHHKIPYWPSASVQRLAQRFPNYLSRSTRAQIYDHLSTALSGTVADLANEFEGSTTFVPPFSAIVLDRARRPAEIPGALLAVRAEYAGFRREMRALEEQRRDARSIRDRVQVINRMQFLCEELSKPFANPNRVTLTSALRILPEMSELAVNATSPTTWITTLLNKPAEWLVQWYRRRPISKLLKAADRVASLDAYDTLLQKHFGAGAIEALNKHAAELSRLERND